MTGLSKGNLSSHLTKLEEAGMVFIVKSFVGKIPNTNITLTGSGEDAIDKYWKRLDQMRKEARIWKPKTEQIN